MVIVDDALLEFLLDRLAAAVFALGVAGFFGVGELGEQQAERIVVLGPAVPDEVEA